MSHSPLATYQLLSSKVLVCTSHPASPICSSLQWFPIDMWGTPASPFSTPVTACSTSGADGEPPPHVTSLKIITTQPFALRSLSCMIACFNISVHSLVAQPLVEVYRKYTLFRGWLRSACVACTLESQAGFCRRDSKSHILGDPGMVIDTGPYLESMPQVPKN